MSYFATVWKVLSLLLNHFWRGSYQVGRYDLEFVFFWSDINWKTSRRRLTENSAAATKILHIEFLIYGAWKGKEPLKGTTLPNVALFNHSCKGNILTESLTVFPMFTGCLEYQRTVHVSLRGNDTKRCGSIKKPCRTIAKAVTRVSGGGMVILDGSGTEKQPYDCEKLTTRAHYPGIRVTRSVTMTSLPSTEAHVTCPKGFHFHGSNESLRISLSGLSFSKTTLKFIKCSHVEIINCTLRRRHSDKTARESAVVLRV